MNTEIMIMGIFRQIFPIVPGTSRSGTTAATLVRMASKTGTAIIRAPRTAASM